MNGNDFLCQVHQGYLWERQADETKAVYARSSDEWFGAGSETADFSRAWPKLFGR